MTDLMERLNGWVKILATVGTLTVGVVWGYANLTAQVDSMRAEVDTAKVERKTLQRTANEITVQQAVTQEQLKQILEAVKEIKEDVKEIKKKDD